jgi:hypothetical protein
VLIAGGAVARDYFDLLIASADTAWESAQRRNAATFTIGTEDVQAAAGLRLERKQSDLRNDAGRDATRLETRFEDLVSFVRDRETFFFLVRREHMDTDWGREIVELEDLRFVHRIMTTRPNTASWRGVDTIVFMVDFAALVAKRMRKRRSSSGSPESRTNFAAPNGFTFPTGPNRQMLSRNGLVRSFPLRSRWRSNRTVLRAPD